MQRAKNIDLNDNGEMKHVSDEFVTDPLVEAKLNPDGLLITCKDPNTQETFRYMMKLTRRHDGGNQDDRHEHASRHAQTQTLEGDEGEVKRCCCRKSFSPQRTESPRLGS